MTKSILLIEDSITTLRALSRLLVEHGYSPVEAKSMAEAQALLTSKSDYLCAVMDYTLPDAPDGETLPLLLEHKLPTIILTGNTDEAVREHLLLQPIFDYVPKDNPAALEYVRKLVSRVEQNKHVKVLLVDDSKTVRNHLRSLLERQLYQVLEAATAEIALAVLQKEPDIRLVLADQDMPGMNGIHMTSEIRRLYGSDSMAIVGISGSLVEGLTARFIKAGADDFLRKPFNAEEFFCRVTRNIEFVENMAALNSIAHIDALTGLPNRRKFFSELKRVSGGFSIAMLDLDHFKKINDGHGHDVGDLALRHVANLMRDHFPDCLLARFGGEEFVVMLPGHEPVAHRSKLQAFCRHVEAGVISNAPDGMKVTLSIGFSSSKEPDITHMLKLADTNLYKAKESGRNQVMP